MYLLCGQHKLYVFLFSSFFASKSFDLKKVCIAELFHEDAYPLVTELMIPNICTG